MNEKKGSEASSSASHRHFQREIIDSPTVIGDASVHLIVLPAIGGKAQKIVILEQGKNGELTSKVMATEGNSHTITALNITLGITRGVLYAQNWSPLGETLIDDEGLQTITEGTKKMKGLATAALLREGLVVSLQDQPILRVDESNGGIIVIQKGGEIVIPAPSSETGLFALGALTPSLRGFTTINGWLLLLRDNRQEQIKVTLPTIPSTPFS